jgi:hypothetical protein
VDAAVSNHERGCVTTSFAAAVTTPTRDAGHHDGCTTIIAFVASGLPQSSERSASCHNDATVTGHPSTSAT